MNKDHKDRLVDCLVCNISDTEATLDGIKVLGAVITYRLFGLSTLTVRQIAEVADISEARVGEALEGLAHDVPAVGAGHYSLDSRWTK
jgi:hypothetical protein